MKGNFTLDDIKNLLGVDLESVTANVPVTPGQAKQLLAKCNKANRRIKPTHVETLRRDMESGNWYSDIDYIGFNKDGTLINGQHRLKALSEANVTSVRLKIDFDVDQHISMDTGAMRTYADQVAISKKIGVDIFPNRFKSIINTGLKLSTPGVSLSNVEFNVIWDAYGDKILECERNGLFELGPKAGSAVKSSLLWAYLSGVDMKTLKHIASVIKNGVARSDYDIPIIRLRDELFDIRGNGKSLDLKRAMYTQQCVFDVLNGSVSNRLPSRPVMHYQQFPIMDVIKQKSKEVEPV